MLRLLIDTNVLLSGLFFEGNEEKILNAFRFGKILLIIPEHVLTEAKRIIQKKEQNWETRKKRCARLKALFKTQKLFLLQHTIPILKKQKE